MKMNFNVGVKRLNAEMRARLIFYRLSSKRCQLGAVVIMGLLSPATWAEVEHVNGEKVYKENCMICHGEDGSGFMPGVPDLSESTSWKTVPINDLLRRVKQGVQSPGSAVAMPPKGGNAMLTDSELKAALVYMNKTIP